MVYFFCSLPAIFGCMNLIMKDLAKKDKEFREDYTATKASIVLIGMVIIAIASVLITSIIIFF